jgi:hypothetical protein
MKKERLMLVGRLNIYDGVLPFLALVIAAGIVREAISRARAGSIWFRLPLASLAKRGKYTTAPAYFLIVVSLGLLTLVAITDRTANALVIPIWLLWSSVSDVSLNTRRDAKRWLVLTTGLLGLVLAAVALASGLQELRAGGHSPPILYGPLLLAFSVLFFVMGAAALHEYVSGTRVRERGIEAFCRIQPWSRIVVKDWRASPSGFDLYMTILSPRFFGTPYGRASEVIIPIPAALRPALEDFLAGHTTAAVRLRSGEEAFIFPETFYTNHEQSDA